MLHEAVEITDEMIAAGSAAIRRELAHPERDDIGAHKARYVAKAVFRAMLAAQERYAEIHDAPIKQHEPLRCSVDCAGAPHVIAPEAKAALPVPGSDQSEATYAAAVGQREGDAINDAMSYAVPIDGQSLGLAEQIVERMFPRLIWVVNEEIQRALAQAGDPAARRAMLIAERFYDGSVEWRSPEN